MTRRAWRNVDWAMAIAILGLLGVGLALVYSASHVPALPGRSGLFARQVSWLGIGMVAMILAAAIPFRVWEEYGPILFGVSIALLIAVPLLGVERLGARRWLMIGGFQFQPSELAKVATLLLLARVLAQSRGGILGMRTLVTGLAVATVPFVLILTEPDLGTSLSIPAAAVPMLYWAGLPIMALLVVGSPLVGMILSINLWLWLPFLAVILLVLRAFRARRSLIILVLGVNMLVGAGAPVLWKSLKPYQRQRVMTFLNPETDRTGAGYQVIQSRIAIGSGGTTGRGWLQGTQKGLAFLPQQHTDFVFSVLGEEFGFAGCAGVLFLFALLIQRALAVAAKARSRFASILAVGIAGGIVFHVFVNVGMTLGLMPVTGLPLPLLSYGGTFLLTTMIQMGLLFNVALRRHEI